MRNALCRRAVLGLAATLLLACAARAQQTAPPRRPSGPIAGPVITLPAGQGEALDEPNDRRSASESARPAAPAPTRWEYCAITGVGWTQRDQWTGRVYIVSVRYFAGGPGERFEGASADEALAAAMNKLGEEGWELAGVRPAGNVADGAYFDTGYFFKRPKTTEARPPQQ